MRRFFRFIGDFFIHLAKYIWIPLAFAGIVGIVYASVRFGAFDAFTDWFNDAAAYVFESVEFLWFANILEKMMDWFIDDVGVLIQLLLGLPFFALIVVLAILFFVLSLLWGLVSLIIAALLMILYFILSILFIYVLVPAAAIGAIFLLIRLRLDAYEFKISQTVHCGLFSIAIITLTVFYFMYIATLA